MYRSGSIARVVSLGCVLSIGCGRGGVTSTGPASPAASARDAIAVPSGAESDLSPSDTAEVTGPAVTREIAEESTLDAESVLASAIDQASHEDKNVLVHVGSPG
jgi:hypothetical protein